MLMPIFVSLFAAWNEIHRESNNKCENIYNYRFESWLHLEETHTHLWKTFLELEIHKIWNRKFLELRI